MKQSVALVGVQTGIDVVLREDILTNLKKTKVCICDDDELLPFFGIKIYFWLYFFKRLW